MNTNQENHKQTKKLLNRLWYLNVSVIIAVMFCNVMMSVVETIEAVGGWECLKTYYIIAEIIMFHFTWKRLNKKVNKNNIKPE